MPLAFLDSNSSNEDCGNIIELSSGRRGKSGDLIRRRLYPKLIPRFRIRKWCWCLQDNHRHLALRGQLCASTRRLCWFHSPRDWSPLVPFCEAEPYPFSPRSLGPPCVWDSKHLCSCGLNARFITIRIDAALCARTALCCVVVYLSTASGRKGSRFSSTQMGGNEQRKNDMVTLGFFVWTAEASKLWMVRMVRTFPVVVWN